MDRIKRKDTKLSEGPNAVFHKTKESRRSRSAASKSVPAELRSSNQAKLEISEKSKYAGYRCSECKEIKIQNNPGNFERQFAAKRKDKKLKSIAEIEKAIEKLVNILIQEVFLRKTKGETSSDTSL